MKIYEFENFLSDEECDLIVAWFNSTPKVINNGHYLFNGKTIDYANVQNTQIKRIMNAFKLESTILARRLFAEDLLYCDYTAVVLWEPGSGMVIHSDNSDLEGNPNYCHWRNYSGVVYLNDDFQGGETFFPDYGPYFIKPKKGKLALYPAGTEYAHAVSTVVGTRYTMPIWFTKDKNHIEV